MPQAPTPGSNQIRFSASIAMLRSAGTVEFKATPADLNITGAKFKAGPFHFKAGPFHFEVKAPETAGKGDRRQPCGIEMKTRRDLKEIKQVALKAGDRTCVAERGMSGRFGEENEAVWAIPGLDQLPASAEVVVTVYRDQEHPKTVRVPVDGMMASDCRRNAEVARWRIVLFRGKCPWGNARTFLPKIVELPENPPPVVQGNGNL